MTFQYWERVTLNLTLTNVGEKRTMKITHETQKYVKLSFMFNADVHPWHIALDFFSLSTFDFRLLMLLNILLISLRFV